MTWVITFAWAFFVGVLLGRAYDSWQNRRLIRKLGGIPWFQQMSTHLPTTCEVPHEEPFAVAAPSEVLDVRCPPPGHPGGPPRG